MIDDRYIKRNANTKEYHKILKQIQKEQNKLLWEMNEKEDFNPKYKESKMKAYVRKYVKDRGFEAPNLSFEELTQRLTDDLVYYSTVTMPLNDPNVEGININSYEDIKITLRDGSTFKIDGFLSPEHGVDIIRRLILPAHKTLDRAIPMVEASIGNDIRITALTTPIVSKEVGVCAYIRKLSKQVFTRDQYLEGDFASADELNMLETALKRGVSMLIVGKVNTGKTTFLTYLLSTLPEDRQIITIESGAREIDLVKRNAQCEVINNVCHLLTRNSSKEEENITQEKLVEKVLRLNADVMAVAEMRNIEAYAAQEASLVGTAVISTTHAGSAYQAHTRVAELCRKRYPTDFKTALRQACEAFPIIVFVHTPSDGRRRIMSITECVVNNLNITYNRLYEYRLNSVGRVLGAHKKLNDVSDKLIEKMRLFSITEEEIKLIKGLEC